MAKETRNKKAAQEKALRDTKNRIVFVQEACKRLLEKNVAGMMPDSFFKRCWPTMKRNWPN